MTDITIVFLDAFQQFLNQVMVLLPKAMVAIVIWLVGRYFINLAVGVLRKVEVPGVKLGDRAVSKFSLVVMYVGKLVLVLVVLDYLEIGRTVIGAIANGLVFTIAISLGLAFGKALEDDAKQVVNAIKSQLKG